MRKPVYEPGPLLTATASRGMDRVNGVKILVLNYHKVDNQNISLSVLPKDFDRQMKYLKDNNFHTITMDEMYAALTEGAELPENPVVITFDDAGKRAENSLPYQRTQLGYMVWTRITIEGTSREMWLPVMDGNNNPLMDSPYTVTNKWGNETQIAPINISDVNRSIMRCLVKNLAMFGLGLYIYSKDDLPSEVDVDNETGEVIEPDAAPAPAAPVPTPTLEEAYALKVKVGKATFPMGDLVEKATNPEKGKRALERLAAVDTEEGAAAKVILDALASGAVHFPPAAAAQA